MKIKPLLLIASSEKEEAKFLQESLSGPDKYDVLTAYNAGETIKKLYGNNPDLMIIDTALAGVDTFELVKDIKSRDDMRFIPIVLILGKGDPTSRKRGIEAGCDDIISKPVEKDDIDTRVYTLLQISYCRPLLNEKEKFECVLNNIGEGIIVFDRGMRIIHINDRAADFLEINPAKIPQNFLTHVNANFKIAYKGDLVKSINTGPLFFDIERSESESTRALILEIKSKVVKNPLGELSSIIMTMTNVTELRREEALKRDFLSLISHKLRTPLTVIDGNIDLFNQGVLGELNDRQRHAIGSISKRTKDLEKLLNKLLGFIRTIRDGNARTKELVDLSTYIPDLLAPLVKNSPDKKVNLKIEAPKANTFINVNRLYFDVVIENLVENAIKFNDKEETKIDILAKKYKDTVEISVSDNGKGIPPEEKEKIFDKFYQVEKFFTGNVEGAGLGLAIVKNIIESLGGGITLKSYIGKGTKFTFTIPI